jgi:hypothetical protein
LILGKKHIENVFEVLLREYYKLPYIFNLSIIKLSLVDRRREQLPLLSLRLEIYKSQKYAACNIESIVGN